MALESMLKLAGSIKTELISGVQGRHKPIDAFQQQITEGDLDLQQKFDGLTTLFKR